MESHLLLREHPRALALRPTVLEEAPSGVLVLEQHKLNLPTSTTKAMATLVSPSDFEDSQWRILNSRPVFGCLGLIDILGESFVAIVTDCISLGRIRAGEEVYKIQSVTFYSLTSSKYDNINLMTDDWDSDDWLDQPTINNNGGNDNGVFQHPCAQLQKLLSIGNFYFTPDFDLTKTVQKRTSSASTMGAHSFDDHFLWNKFLISGLLEFRNKLDKKKQMDLDRGGFLVFAIRGYVGIETIIDGNEKYELSTVSKLSCKRAGTRFNSRGIDDNGHVANFVETETVLCSDRTCYSFTQIRGSVPVFWEQQGMQLVNHKIQIARGPDATQPAVKRHFDELTQRYQNVSCLNLLSQEKEKNSGEALLSKAYNAAVKQLGQPSQSAPVNIINFDLHAECRGGNYENLGLLMNIIQRSADTFGYFLMDSDDNQIITCQQGVFRTNCMDCLDRTNLVQNEVSRKVLLGYLNNKRKDQGTIDRFITAHANLWAENGDGLSKIYAGTGALKSAFTRTGKVTLMNVLSDAARSANRFYINNFQDKARQEIIDQLLGKLAGQREILIHDPISDSVSQLMQTRLKEYSTVQKITIFCGTYNLNGKSFKGESLDPWLLQHLRWNQNSEPDIYVIGFQEIVELSPQQVMATDAEKRTVWEQQIERTLNSKQGDGKSRYVLLRSNQLVGAALIIFVKASVVENIRNVETSTKKTGLMGMAGNKGAVAIRMEYGDTSFCFLAAHFASGQSNVDDRNADFHTINQGLQFQRGRSIDSHSNIVWVSDFNYRVSLLNEEARALANAGNIEGLLRNDQLIREMNQGNVFQGYQEGQITFMPTYKYDNGTDVYDTSEKQRVPGWTDRIVFKGKQLKQVQYDRADLYTSDHRPVLALFETEILILDQAAKTRLQNQLYKKSLETTGSDHLVSPSTIPPNLPKRKPITPARPSTTPTPPPSFTPKPVMPLIDLSEDDVSFFMNLPPPSTDNNRWWDDGNEQPKADKKRTAQGRNPFSIQDTKNSSSSLLPSALTNNGLNVAWTPSVLSPSSPTNNSQSFPIKYQN
ncbi:SacI homology domain-containing protein [Halteromyces radiatus]|uniref:SacI homology domain-containing protein n=1 Tax=Halteromyces radiatus TaxID=101107 RepID=UPI00221E618B|nr:SacI homology domain-containing protein [Halteromyces radiatus]KAI8079720.1 SacI homology domain-containing protein [Halteromyces radiatus]